MITIKNSQRTIKINISQLKADAQKILRALDYADFDLGIWITTNKTIRHYNKTYRKKDKATDILSFSYHSDIKPGQRIVAQTEEDKNLGDLIISAEYVVHHLKDSDVTLDERMRVLLVHGICHLLGYEHATDAQYEQMHKLETKLLKLLV